MNDFLFQCVSKKTMNVAISQNEEFNNRLKKHLLDMNDIEIEYRDNAPIFSLTPFVQVNIHQNCDSYYVVVIPDFQVNQFGRFVPTLKGIFFDYNEETGYIVFYNSKNNEILLNEPLKNVLSLDKNILKIKKKDFSNFVLIMQSALQGKKKRLDISFKSSIEKKDVTYILESSYKNQSHTLGYFRNIDSYAKEIEKKYSRYIDGNTLPRFSLKHIISSSKGASSKTVLLYILPLDNENQIHFEGGKFVSPEEIEANEHNYSSFLKEEIEHLDVVAQMWKEFK